MPQHLYWQVWGVGLSYEMVSNEFTSCDCSLDLLSFIQTVPNHNFDWRVLCGCWRVSGF